MLGKMDDVLKGMMEEGMWIGIGACVGLLAVVAGIMQGRNFRKERGLANLPKSEDPIRSVQVYENGDWV